MLEFTFLVPAWIFDADRTKAYVVAETDCDLLEDARWYISCFMLHSRISAPKDGSKLALREPKDVNVGGLQTISFA